MTLRRRLALRYNIVSGLCLLLLGGLAYHEFIVEPHIRRLLGQVKPSGSTWGEIAELVFHLLIPLVLIWGWIFIRKTLTPIDALTRDIERLQTENLCEPLPRSHNGDEIDRLTEAFNRTTARLHDSFQQIRQFTLQASHELKTPLSVMRVQLESALNEPDSPLHHHRDWALAQLDEIQRLARLVDSLTLLAKAEGGILSLERLPVRLDEIVRELIEDTLILAESALIHVQLVTCQPVEVLGDRHRLRQLLLNLADNAVKYNQTRGRITVALMADQGMAVLTLANTGLVVPDSMKSRVFDYFVRTPEARAHSSEGSGLGLTLCQWIVQAHGGTIQLSSSPEGITTVEVRLPLVSAPTLCS